jgi:FPC/CPF motif-containing protein YcgG
MISNDHNIIEDYLGFINEKEFPCVVAKAALARNHIKSHVASHMACPASDVSILHFLYDFVDQYRLSSEPYHSAAVIFKGPLNTNEETFDALLWERLNALSVLDKISYAHDSRVASDPEDPNYSYSIKSEAFFVVGLHPGSERRSRRFKYPALIFNPHAEFEKLRRLNRYEKLKGVVRKRDVIFSGTVNPMLDDFGNSSEAIQYSGKRHASEWKCPLAK